MNILDQVLSDVSLKVNIPLDLLKTLFLMFLSIPLSMIFRMIGNPLFRYIFSVAFGSLFLVFLLHQWVFYVVSVAIVPFLCFKLVGKHQYAIAMVSSSLFLLFIHVYRFMYDTMSWKIDCSVSVMYLVTRVIYYGNYIELHKQKISFFKYICYCFFFPTVVVGPTLSYTTFQNFIQMKFGYEFTPFSSNTLLKQVSKAVIFTTITALTMSTFTQYWALTNPWYLSLSPISKFLFINAIGLFFRSKFYTAWAITQISLDISGISWNQKAQNYSSVRCGSPRFQLEINPRNKTNHWNSSIQIWLKQMVYDKSIQKIKSTNLGTFITFIYSAFWHGVYLTYYVGFVQWALVIIISKWAYRMSLSYPKIAQQTIVKLIAYIVGFSMLNYIGLIIVVLTWKQALQVYKDMYFVGNILMAILLLLSFLIKPKSSRHKGQMKNSRKIQGDSKTQAKIVQKQRDQ